MLLLPTFTLFTFHWYAGLVPPLPGVAVYVTEVPAHTELDEAAIETLTGNSGLTIIVTTLDVAGLPVAQDIEEVSTQVTASLFTGV